MHDKTRKVITGVAALAAAGGLTAGIAGAARTGKAERRGALPHPAGPPEAALTGDAKTKAEAAALAAVPGATVVSSEEEGRPGARYEVHLTDAGGKPVTVLLDAGFAVVDKLSGPPEGGPFGHGHGGPGGPGMPAQEALTGDVKDKAEAAALAAVPGGKVDRAEQGGPGGAAYHVHMTDADGKPVVVLLDKDFAVLGKVDDGFGGPGGPHPRPAPLTGDVADKAKAAAADAVKDGTVRAAFAAPDGAPGAYVVLVERKSGRPVVLLLDKDFKVVQRLARPDMGRGGPDGYRGGPPPRGAGFPGPPPETTST